MSDDDELDDEKTQIFLANKPKPAPPKPDGETAPKPDATEVDFDITSGADAETKAAANQQTSNATTQTTQPRPVQPVQAEPSSSGRQVWLVIAAIFAVIAYLLFR